MADANVNYLAKLKEKLWPRLKTGESITEEELNALMKSAAGHAGGTATAAKKQNLVASEITDYRVLYELPKETSEPPLKIQVLPVPGTYRHPSYGNIKITKERNENFVNNFNNKIYQDKLPIDAEHETKLSGAFGWITQLEVNSEGGVDAVVDWTDKGTTVFEEDRFRYFSPEWYDTWKDPATGKKYDDVLIGGAVTNHPFFKDPALKPLVASEMAIEPDWEDVGKMAAEMPDNVAFDSIRESITRQLREKYPPNAGGIDNYSWVSDVFPGNAIYSDPKGKYFKVPYTVDDDGDVSVDFNEAKPVERMTMWRPLKMGEKINPAEDPDAIVDSEKMANQPDVNDVHSEKMLKKCDVCGGMHAEGKCPGRVQMTEPSKFAETDEYKSMSEQITSLQSQLAEAKQASEDNKKLSEALTASENRIAALETSAQEARFRNIVTGTHRWYGEVDKNVKRLASLAKAFGEDSDEFKEFVAEQQTLAENLSKSEQFKEIGTEQAPDKKASDFQEALKKYQEAHTDKTQAEAIEAVLDANPQFYAEYRKRMNEAAAKGEERIVSL